MADTLSKHYADGRLDETEFKVRLDKAMSAKTRRDLSGLLKTCRQFTPKPARPKHLFARRVWWAFTAFAVLVALTIGAARPSISTSPGSWCSWCSSSVGGRYRFHHHHHHHRRWRIRALD